MARPHVVSERRLALAFWPAVGGWLLFESWLAVRELRRRPDGVDVRDHGTRALCLSANVASGAVQGAAALLALGPALPGGRRRVLAGAGLTWLGLLVRAWSVLALGRFFRLSVSAHADHELVVRGPYRAVRHPSYAGATLVTVGAGLALGTLVGAAAGLVLPVGAYLVRIAVEERALEETLGDDYRAYAARTARLIPFVW